MDVGMAKERLMQFQQFVKEYLAEGEDFGTIPGTPKPTLLKPGADKLCELYGLSDDYEVTQRTENFDKGLFDYEVKCVLMSKAGGFLVSTGLGSCNSYEKRYRWRNAQRLCPNCGKDAIIKGKAEYSGGWLCFNKKGGCGAKFADGDKSIEGQVVGKIPNEDVADLKNTILKMAKKRAKIDATLSATRSSGVFTQDIEDWDIPKSVPAPSPDAISHPAPEPAGAPATTQQDQPATQTPAEAPQANQRRVQIVKRVPPNNLVFTVAAVKLWPAEGKVNASMNVAFTGKLLAPDGKWTCEFATCWHVSLFDLIQGTVGKVVEFFVTERDKAGKHYVDINDVVSITDKNGEYVEYMDGKPVIQGEQK
jgi:hypothetical protein